MKIKEKILLNLYIFLKKGGLKLKFIGFSVSIIIVTVFILSTIIINIMGTAIEKKAFEVTTSSINHLGDFSKIALLERSYENQVNLSEIIKELNDAKIEGFLDISIYEREKKEQSYKFIYLAGFKQYKQTKYLVNRKLIDKLNSIKNNDLLVDEIEYEENGKDIEAYRFVRPIIYKFKEQDILLGAIVLLYDKNAINKVINKTIFTTILFTIIMVSILIVIVYFVGLRLTKPILSISEAVNSVAKGNLDIDLKVESRDEIGVLVKSFNRMINGLREREKMEKFVSDSTIDMIQKDRKADLVLGGEYRKLTFLFSDIRGFTKMSETKKPDEVVEIVNFYLDLQAEIIEKNDGDIDKFVGDEIMASFSGEDSIQKAINCAIQIQKVFNIENKKREKLNLSVCEVGIGINTGEVIVGNIGSKDRMDFTSIGSSVNLASRLCSLAKENEILVEENIANEIKDIFKIEKKELITVKGFSKPIEVSQVIF